MTAYRYFADTNGQTVELTKVRHESGLGHRASDFAGLPVGVEPKWTPEHGWATGFVRATRKIQMTSSRPRHECDARCMNATGRVMKCECACGGKNHGRGNFVAEAA